MKAEQSGGADIIYRRLIFPFLFSSCLCLLGTSMWLLSKVGLKHFNYQKAH